MSRTNFKTIKSSLIAEPQEDGFYLSQVNKLPIRGKILTCRVLTENSQKKLNNVREKTEKISAQHSELIGDKDHDPDDAKILMNKYFEERGKLSLIKPKYVQKRLRVLSWEKGKAIKNKKGKTIKQKYLVLLEEV